MLFMLVVFRLYKQFEDMKTQKSLLILAFLAIAMAVQAQEERDWEQQRIQTLFTRNPVRNSGGYGAVTNKFTTIDGRYANMVEMYGGWYINHWFLLGLSGAAVTNNIPVPAQYSAAPGQDLSYMYGQFGLKTEYVLSSHRTFHVAFNLMTGAGFTTQYDRYYYRENSNYGNLPYNTDWFFVAEPGVQLEVNVFRWMRFSPGYSYRAVYGSNAEGLRDESLSGNTFNLTLKFGRF